MRQEQALSYEGQIVSWVCHCEERSDEAISMFRAQVIGSHPRNDIFREPPAIRLQESHHSDLRKLQVETTLTGWLGW